MLAIDIIQQQKTEITELKAKLEAYTIHNAEWPLYEIVKTFTDPNPYRVNNALY